MAADAAALAAGLPCLSIVFRYRFGASSVNFKSQNDKHRWDSFLVSWHGKGVSNEEKNSPI